MKKYIGYVICGIVVAGIIIVIVGNGVKINDKFDIVTCFEQFQTKGAMETDANPWNVTIGLIEENGENYVLMVPGTALSLKDINEYDSFEFKYRLYLSSANGADEMEVQSDGAGLSVIYYDEEGQVMREDAIFIDSHADEHSYVTIPQTAFSSYVRSIEIQCNSGYNGDGILDWVILR